MLRHSLVAASCAALLLAGLGFARAQTETHPSVMVVESAASTITAGSTNRAVLADLRVERRHLKLALAVRYAVAVHANEVQRARQLAAIRLAISLSEKAKQSSRFISHTRVIPPPAWQPNWTADRWCQVAPFIRSVFGADGSWAVSIAMRESRCEPGAYNPSGASGIFQIMPNSWHGPCPWSQRFDATCNIEAAYRLFQMRGRQPWSL